MYNPTCADIFNFFDTKEYSSICLAANKNKGRPFKNKKRRKIIPHDTSQIVAEKFGISKRTVAHMVRLKKEADKDIIDSVIKGELSIRTAYDIVFKDEEEKPRECVYFIQHIYSEKIKIGKTVMMNSRFNRINMANGGDTKLLLIIDGYTSKETELHRRFIKYRCCGEWFEPAQEILDYIEENSLVK
jgi:hypothetical protein